MARRITSRLKITGSLVALGPLHVGGADDNADVDLALARNGNGQWYVPGTSLAGAIRAWLRRRLGESQINGAWGFQDQDETKRQPDGHASFVIVENGEVKLPPGALVEIREGVGIDRVLGGAAENIKYNRAVLPSGTEINLEMTVELPTSNDATRDQLLAALQALQSGAIRFGAAKTRGLGKVMLKELEVVEQELLSFDGMLAALRGQSQPVDVNDAANLPKLPTIDITIDWAPRGPLMVKAERDGVVVDMLPLVSAKAGDLTFVLPGSSIKGALRSQAERIVRTVCGITAPPLESPRKDFMRQIEMRDATQNNDQEETPGLRLIGGLFGRAGKKDDHLTAESERSRNGKPPGAEQQKNDIDDPPELGLGALTVEDCYAIPRFTPQHWEAIETAPETDDIQIKEGLPSPLLRALDNAGLSQMQQAFHVAIDRWTGGAADGFLYTVLEPHGVVWEPIQLTLDLKRLRNEDRLPALMCLLLTLRDLVNGRIRLGFGANRGMGALEVTGVRIAPVNLNDELNALNDLKDVSIVDGKLGGWSNELKQTLESEWSDWVSKEGEARSNGAVRKSD